VHGGGDAVIEDGPDLTVFGDVEALKRLFANLIGNAVAYGEAASVLARREDDEAVVEVRDRGPGLPDSELERVFEPFYRADRARNLNAGGMGLGLAIVRSIALEHGGHVHLEAATPGLRAVVRLPLDLEPSPTGKPPVEADLQPSRRSVPV
jgi:two-component system, OmpR family, sensor kinase